MGKGKKVLSGILGVVTGIGIGHGLAPESHSEVPSHTERVQELSRLRSALPMGYEPYFAQSWLKPSGDTLGNYLINFQGARSAEILAVGDKGFDGSIDLVLVQEKNQGQDRYCLMRTEDIAEGLVEDMNEHYEVSSEAFYRAIKEGAVKYEGLLGQEQFEELKTLCEGRWEMTAEEMGGSLQPLEDVTFQDDIPDHKERIEELRGYRAVFMGYSPHFHQAWSQSYNGLLANSLMFYHSENSFDGLAIGDQGYDGTIDLAGILEKRGTAVRRCLSPVEDLPESISKDFDAHYVESTEAFYRTLHENLPGYQGLLGEEVFQEFVEFCEDKWQVMDHGSLTEDNTWLVDEE